MTVQESNAAVFPFDYISLYQTSFHVRDKDRILHKYEQTSPTESPQSIFGNYFSDSGGPKRSNVVDRRRTFILAKLPLDGKGGHVFCPFLPSFHVQSMHIYI
jgi:hypothetical protein